MGTPLSPLFTAFLAAEITWSTRSHWPAGRSISPWLQRDLCQRKALWIMAFMQKPVTQVVQSDYKLDDTENWAGEKCARKLVKQGCGIFCFILLCFYVIQNCAFYSLIISSDLDAY